MLSTPFLSLAHNYLYPLSLFHFSTYQIYSIMSTRASPQDSVSGPELPLMEINASGDDFALDGARTVLQLEKPPSAGIPTKKVQFLDLPRELRLMIYQPLIEVGDLSILRVSKLVAREVISLLSKYAVFRVNVGRRYHPLIHLDLCAGITFSGNPTLTAPDYIQNVNFRIDMVNLVGPDFDLKFINYFGGDKIPRKSCIITISLNESAEVPSRLENDETYRAIANLTGFNVLVLKLECEGNGVAVAAILRRYGLGVVQMGEMSTGRLMVRSYAKILGFLQTTLGPAGYQKGIYQHALVFRPGQYKIGDRPMAGAKA